MLKSIQSGAIGLKAQVARNDVIANNLANAATDGFKRQLVQFEAKAQASPSQGGASPQSSSGSGLDVSTITDFSRGDVMATANPLDLAVEGDGFFAVETEGGERFTRMGSFRLNDQGEMVTASGFKLMGNSGPIAVDVAAGLPEVAIDGTISVGGNAVGQVKVVRFDDPTVLTREGDNLFADSSGSAQTVDPTTVRMVSGFVEGSNVNAVREMVSMISALRTYQSNEKSIRAADEMLDTMINRIGRVRGSGG